jgi:cytochrome c oxidase assembly protein subunit 15
MNEPRENRRSPWSNRVAKLLAIVVFPLIWVGGLVTTTDAGMAVPDWPNTYNYNMFAYPIRDWFFGPWDLFVEHGHRLLGMLSGIVAILLVVVTWLRDRRGLARIWSAGVLVLVIFQGVLGGQRVVHDQRLLALIHGCVGPAFFATVVAMVVITSRWWFDLARRVSNLQLRSTDAAFVTALGLLLMSYVQLVLGACLRHIRENADPNVYSALMIAHLTTAVVIVIGAILNVVVTRTENWSDARIAKVAQFLLALVIVQFALGLVTYIVKFGFPNWLGGYPYTAGFVITEKSFWQTTLITTHVAVGSLILATATYEFVRVWRAIGKTSEVSSKEKAATLEASRSFAVQSMP